MANQAFDYDLLISVGEAEKRIAQFAKTIERELGNSVEKAFKGSFDFDISPIQRKIKEIESQVKTLGQTFKGSFDFDMGPVNKQLDFTITKAQQLADAVGGNASNAPWMRMQRRMEQVTRLSEELRANFTDPFSMAAINQLESKLKAISEDLKGKKTGSFSEAREWDSAFSKAREDFDKGSPARQAAASRELSQAINAANQLHDLEMRNNQELSAAQEATHNKRMRELQQEASAKEAADKVNYQEKVSQSQTDITTTDERRIANQARITKVFEDEFKRREQLDLEIEARVHGIKAKNLTSLAAQQRKNEADAKAGVDAFVSAEQAGHAQIKADELRLAEQRKQYTKQFQSDKYADIAKTDDANTKMYNRMMEQSKRAADADNIRYAGQRRLIESLGQAHAENQAELVALFARREQMSSAAFRNELQRERELAKARLDLATRKGYNATNADLAAAAKGGRAVSNMFQVQQAFEDFQYAGLRGAANNIAMMAANMGGSAGLVALGGIMVAQLASSAGLWDTLNESLNGFLWKLEAVTEEEEKQNNLAKARFDSQRDAFKQRLEYQLDNYESLSGKATKEKENIDNLRAEVQQVREAAGAYKQMAEQAKLLEAVMPTGWTGRFQTSPEETASNIEKYKELLKNPDAQLNKYGNFGESGEELRKRIADAITIFELHQKHFEATANGMSLTEEGQKALTDREKEYVAELTKANSEYKTTLQLVEEMQQAFAELGRIQNKTYGSGKAFSSDGLSGRFKKSFEYDADQSKILIEKAKAEAKLAADSIQDSYAAEITAARKAGNDQRAIDLAKEMDDKIRDQRHSVEDLIESESRRLMGLQQIAKEGTEAEEAFKKSRDAAVAAEKELTSEVEKKLQATKSLVQADEARLRVLEDQKSALIDHTGKQALDLEAKHLGHVAKLETDAYTEKAKKGKEAYLQQVEAQKEIDRQRYEWLKRNNEKGKGDGNPDVGLTEAYNRYKAQREAEVKAHIDAYDRIDAAHLKSISRRAELEQKAMFKEYDKGQRDKLAQLQEQEAALIGQGKIPEALQVRGQIFKLLGELRAAQEKMVGQGTKEESKDAVAEVAKLNQMLIESAGKEEALIKQRRDANLESVHEHELGLQEILRIVTEIQAMPLINPDMSKLDKLIERLMFLKSLFGAGGNVPTPSGIPGMSVPSGAGDWLASVPAYADGSTNVPKTGLALIHQGEIIIPAKMAEQIRSGASYWSGMEARSGAPPREGPFFSDQNLMQSAGTIFGAPAQVMKETGLGEQLAKDVATAVNDGLNSGAAKVKGAIKSGATKARDAAADFYNGGDMGNSLPARFKPFRAIPEAADLHRQAEKIDESLKRIKEREAELKPTPDPKSSYKPRPYDSPQEASSKRMSEDKVRASKEALDRAESAQRIRKLEQDAQATRDRLAAGPESTPDYVKRRRGELEARLDDEHDRWKQGKKDAARIQDPTSRSRALQLNKNLNDLAIDYNRAQSKIVDEIEKTHEMVKETKGKVTDAGHEREKMYQKKKAGLDLENQGWKQKHSGGEGGSFRTGDGEYISPESQALEMRQEAARKRAEQLKRARRLSGQSPSQVEQGDVQDAMKLEQQLQSSAQQKAILERLESVKASEVGQANALASALERAAAAKAALSSSSGGGYGVTGSGVSGGPSGGVGSGYGGGGSPTIINNNMTGVMNNASPQSVFAAMQTAAQIASIRRS